MENLLSGKVTGAMARNDERRLSGLRFSERRLSCRPVLGVAAGVLMAAAAWAQDGGEDAGSAATSAGATASANYLDVMREATSLGVIAGAALFGWLLAVGITAFFAARSFPPGVARVGLWLGSLLWLVIAFALYPLFYRSASLGSAWPFLAGALAAWIIVGFLLFITRKRRA